MYHKRGEDREPTMLDRSQLLIIRHAYSEFNNAWKVYTSEQEQNHDNFLKAWAGEHLIDAELHSKGVDQALSQQSLLNSFTFRKVYVSPHRRTIQTALNILASHP